jgi:hypothetical protein
MLTVGFYASGKRQRELSHSAWRTEMKRPLLLLFSLLVISLGTALAVPPLGCTSDADCDNGILCDGVESCDIGTGQCVAIDPCPAAIFGDCLATGACDWEADECLPPQPYDSLCAEDEFCSPSGDCLAFGQDVGSQFCGQVQADAQDAVESGGDYRNHGQMVKTAANAVDPYTGTGAISEECSSCIVNQFARRIPIEEQEACGALCPVDIRSLYPDPLDVDAAQLFCWDSGLEIHASGTDVIDLTLLMICNADQICGGGPGPGLQYLQVIGGVGGPLVGTPLTPEEFTACEEVLRNYGEDLEDAGLVDEGSVAACPLIDPLGEGN